MFVYLPQIIQTIGKLKLISLTYIYLFYNVSRIIDKVFQYHNEYRMLRSFVRTVPVNFHQLLVRLQETLIT